MTQQVKPLSLNLEKAEVLKQVLQSTSFNIENVKAYDTLVRQVDRIISKLSEGQQEVVVNEVETPIQQAI